MITFEAFASATDFLAQSGPFLEANETANNLLLGLALRARDFPEMFATRPFFGLVRRHGEAQVVTLMTPPHNLVVFAACDSGSAQRAFKLVAGSLLREGWPVPGVLGPNEAALGFARTWQTLTGETFQLSMHERVYDLREVIPPPPAPGQFRRAVLDDLEMVARWVLEFQKEALPWEAFSLEDGRKIARSRIEDGSFYLWDDGQPVALAGSTRPTLNGCCVGPVYTPAAFRRKGYGTALTAALSRHLLDSGYKFTALFTDLSNPVSNSIYQKIGYRPVCDYDMYRFEKKFASPSNPPSAA
jgi:predicted GNAT family acetyltransferase